MHRRATALVALSSALFVTTALAAENPSIEVDVKPRTRTKIPVELTCPTERVRCGGRISFSGQKRRAGTTYKLSTDPFQFKTFAGGTSKTIDFRLSRDARRTLRAARGMTVTFVVRARYGEGPRDTVRVIAKLPARPR